MVAALAFALLGKVQVPQPKSTGFVEVSGNIQPGRCRIPIAFEGNSYLFLVDTGIEHSYIRGDVKTTILASDPQAAISIGAGNVPIADLQTTPSSVYTEQPRIAGIVGMDVLSKTAFGIDYGTQKVTLWPADATLDAMKEKFFQPGVTTVTIPLLSERGYKSLFLQTSFGEAELDTGAAVSLLPKTAAQSPEIFSTGLSEPLELFEGGAGHASQVVVRKMTLGNQAVFCQPMLLSDVAGVGVISPNLLGQRVLFDMPERAVVFAGPSLDDEVCRGLGALLHAPVEVRTGELFMKTQLAKNLGPRQDAWVRIVSVNGRKGAAWLSLYENQDPIAATGLQHAFIELAKGGSVLIEHDGKQESLFIAPYIR